MFGGGECPPEPDSCASGDTGGVTALELGAPDDSAFMPWADGDIISVVSGDQGLDMLSLRVRLGGPDVPDCVEFDFAADYPTPSAPESGQRDTAGRRWSLATYADGEARVIKTHFLVLPSRPLPATDMRITVTVGDVSISRSVWVELGPGADAGAADAGAADAGAADARPADAGSSDAGDSDGGI